MTLAYEVEDVVKRYLDQAPANDHISLNVYRSEVFGLLGPNGAGKTTLVRQLSGLTKPTSGKVKLFGYDIGKEPDLATHWVALQPQGFALPHNERVRRLLELTGQLRGMTPAAARRAADGLLEEFGLGAHAAKPFMRLSGGLKRLASIATALIGDRPVLIFDEPTNDLAPEVRRVVWRRIRKASNDGAAVVLVTHNVVEAEQVFDRVAIIRQGRILAMGTPGDMKSRVAQRVRLELLFKPESVEQAPAVLAGWPQVLTLGARRYAVIVPRQDAEQAVPALMPHLELLDDFRIVTPSLEDVYLELSGGEQIDS